ncbi:zf-HC2 domain-containing protein [Kibdelosporangium philippinense]|uniref:Zf-HC2 domain-containing protein n=1 Tax=Kibdelosporangium philippinense TaxID=211113 RepID=A0ABS8Z1M2_9PSEU|nr:zf-HC2 domain-containing protein [Kibdelosporangium philippinense]MCE7001829.1 zf-HC2 domain-containing protein [Kibdelosporangium philippinense]
MSNPHVTNQHDHSSLGAYALGVLTPREATEVEAHLRTCPEGRREVADLVGLRSVMDSVPPEAFIDGPPPGGDLLLQRTLRRVRAEEGHQGAERPSMGRRLAAVAAAVVIAGGAFAGGLAINGGGSSEPPGLVGVASSATDQASGAKMDVTVESLQGWIKLSAKTAGIKQGEQCQLIVTAKNGTQRVAGSWLVTEKGEDVGTTLQGAALIEPKDVQSVDVITFDGRKLVSVPVNL